LLQLATICNRYYCDSNLAAVLTTVLSNYKIADIVYDSIHVVTPKKFRSTTKSSTVPTVLLLYYRVCMCMCMYYFVSYCILYACVVL